MNNLLMHTPEGVKDIYNGELNSKLELSEKLNELVKNKGFKRISTPTFEYFDTFSKDIGSVPSSNLYKMFDRDGNTLVLRPDITPSIARAYAMYFAEQGPAKLTYEGNVYINHQSHQGRLMESTQFGCEYIGDGSMEADAEIISVIVDCLKAAGLSNFKISIGHAEIVRAFLKECAFDAENNEKAINLIVNKNIFGLIDLLKDNGKDESLLRIAGSFAKMYKSMDECAEMSKAISKYSDIKNAIEYVAELFEMLNKKGIVDNIYFEPGNMSTLDYYTGVIIEGYTYGSGEPIVKGGRYDKLLTHFGKDEAAIGFAITMDQLLLALKSGAKEKKCLTIALGKGRLAKKAMQLFGEIGITCEEMNDPDTRKLLFTNEDVELSFFLSKGPDVPTYVEYGAADIGIVGEDTILEENRDIYEVLDLGFGKCRMCVCGPASAKEFLESHEQIRVASKYPRIAKDYFYNKQHQTVEIIKLNGSIELAPIVGLSEVIVDIVETGSTLRENGLEVLDVVVPLSARMVVNRVSMKMDHERISDIINRLKEALEKNA